MTRHEALKVFVSWKTGWKIFDKKVKEGILISKFYKKFDQKKVERSLFKQTGGLAVCDNA